MKRIRFSQPKYIIPLIIIPFNIFLFYMLKDSFTMEKVQKIASEEKKEINANIPLPNLEKREMKSKFESYREAHKYNRDFTAMKDIDRRNQTGLSQQERKIVDSVNNSIIVNAPKNFMSKVKASSGSYDPSLIQKSKSKAEETEYEMQMRLFKDQMKYIDSLSQTSAPLENENVPEKQDSVYDSDHKEEIIRLNKQNDRTSAFFQTIRYQDEPRFIQAIIDENIKVTPGSRVRIRLLDDIYVGDQIIEKGNYLFGIVNSFNAQRVEIQVSSLLLKDQILNVNIEVYDNDGLPGLYIPDSNFRGFTKDLASNSVSNQNLQLRDTPQNQAQMLYDMAERAFSTTTRSMGNLIRRNKAKLKYNTIIYLVNSDSIN